VTALAWLSRSTIAKGVSQTGLPRRLGVSKQVINRFEEIDYQTVAIIRLQEILDAIGIKTAVTISEAAAISPARSRAAKGCLQLIEGRRQHIQRHIHYHSNLPQRVLHAGMRSSGDR
jgi:transcriptional regulator with XRE-family HTH domain